MRIPWLGKIPRGVFKANIGREDEHDHRLHMVGCTPNEAQIATATTQRQEATAKRLKTLERRWPICIVLLDVHKSHEYIDT
jgi:hypothetical protein